MTFIEAWEQAMRETGMSEEDIQRFHRAASVAVPLPKEMREKALPAGRERIVVDALKDLYTLMREHPDVFEPVYERLMAERNQRN